MLTVAELRKHVSTALEDDALQRLLDAATEDIAHFVTATEYITPAGDLLPLSHSVDAIVSVAERDDTLAADDYELLAGGNILRRLNTGTYPERSWRGPIRVTYTRRFAEATKEVVQVALVQMDINYQPGLEQNTAGNWNEMFVADYRAERQKILSRLNGPTQVVWPF
jgi:hypothetical protein